MKHVLEGIKREREGLVNERRGIDARLERLDVLERQAMAPVWWISTHRHGPATVATPAPAGGQEPPEADLPPTEANGNGRAPQNAADELRQAVSEANDAAQNEQAGPASVPKQGARPAPPVDDLCGGGDRPADEEPPGSGGELPAQEATEPVPPVAAEEERPAAVTQDPSGPEQAPGSTEAAAPPAASVHKGDSKDQPHAPAVGPPPTQAPAEEPAKPVQERPLGKALLAELEHGSRTVGWLSVRVGGSRALTRKALHELRDAGLIERRGDNGGYQLAGEAESNRVREQRLYDFIQANEGCSAGLAQEGTGLARGRTFNDVTGALIDSGRIQRVGKTAATRYYTTEYLDRQTAERSGTRGPRRSPQGHDYVRSCLLDLLTQVTPTEEEIAAALDADREAVAFVCGEMLEDGKVELRPDGCYVLPRVGAEA